MEFEWDPAKAASNFKKHGVRFAEAVTIFDDPNALTMLDEGPGEERYVSLRVGSIGRILVVMYASREDRIRIISARGATRQERAQYERKHR